MDYLDLVLVFSFLWACIHVLRSNLLGRTSGCTILPPGPRPLPIIGNILEFGNNPHQALADLSKTYGPLMTLKLGTITTIVISSPDIAKDALQKHDLALSSRIVPDAARAYDHYKNSMMWLPASAHWKNLRKVSATQLFTSQRLDASQALRRKKVQELLDYVQECCINGQAVDIGQAAFTTVLNLMSNTFFSIDLTTYNSSLSQEFSGLVFGVTEINGKPNVADYFPILRLVDPQGIHRQMKSYIKRMVRLFDSIINERTKLSDSLKESEASNVLDSLLILAKDDNSELNYRDVQNMLVDFFIAGTDTSAITAEWAMAELLRNPEKLAKVKNELKEVAGLIHESDISKFPYLQAIVKETFRLHPPAPFLSHKAESDVEMLGFKIPKNAQVLINVWGMGQDPSIWSNPNSFIPERFLEREIDVKGRDFELIPFGAGRRICPGLPLAHRMVHLMLANLIHSFNWKLVDGMIPDTMDMSAKFGLTLRKFEPFLAIPVKL